MAALLLLVGVGGCAYGAWLLSRGAGFIVGGVLLIIWTLVVVVDFPEAARR